MRKPSAALAAVMTGILVAACLGPPAGDAAPARRQPVLPYGGSVFFVGNSLLGWEGRSLPEWLAALGSALGPRFEVGMDIEPGDLPLSDFLNHPEVASALASGGYDVWVVQAHELEPLDRPEEFRRSVRAFEAAITSAGGRMVLFMTWESRWRRELDALAEAYDSIGEELGVTVIPAGLAFRDCERAPPGGFQPAFLTAGFDAPKGGLHANRYGTALNAYLCYAMLTGKNPEGSPFDAPGSDIEPALRRYLSDAAWSRARLRLPEGGN